VWQIARLLYLRLPAARRTGRSAPGHATAGAAGSCLGGETTVVPIEDARHDVFLSLAEPRERAYATVDAWLKQHRLPRVVTLV
jgi:alpha-beta hydrolase superfamily lysophospholipase